jgi:predicted nucleic acid-binding protein
MGPDCYLDTCIWLDHFEERGPRGLEANALLRHIVATDGCVFYSDLILVELRQAGYSADRIGSIMAAAKPRWLRHVHIYQSLVSAARQIARIRQLPLGDVIHALVAKEHGLLLVTHDAHFARLRDLARIATPADLTSSRKAP